MDPSGTTVQIDSTTGQMNYLRMKLNRCSCGILCHLVTIIHVVATFLLRKSIRMIRKLFTAISIKFKSKHTKNKIEYLMLNPADVYCTG